MATQNIDVLIVGAGPVGLFCANEVLRHGLSCRIIDKKMGIDAHSQARNLTIQTLDTLADCGIKENALMQERRADSIALPQNQLETILLSHLQQQGVNVGWQTELTQVSQVPTEITATLKKPHNKLELFHANWLIACDGALNTLQREADAHYRYDRLFFAQKDLNAGIQNVYNLVWKLALVEQGKAMPTLLDSYQEERSPAIATTVFTRIKQLFRKELAAYAKSSVVHQQGFSRLQAGDYLPAFHMLDTLTQHPVSSLKITEGTHHHLLFFTGTKAKKITKTLHIVDNLAEKYADSLKIHVISAQKMTPTHPAITCWIDEQAALHARFGLRQAALMLIRPDKYIGYLQQPINEKRFCEQMYLYDCQMPADA